MATANGNGKPRFTPTEERLLAVVYTLQQRTYKTGLSAAAPVPDAFKKELAGAHAWLVCLRCPLGHSLCIVTPLSLESCRRVQGVWEPRHKWGQTGTPPAAVCTGPGAQLAWRTTDAG